MRTLRLSTAQMRRVLFAAALWWMSSATAEAIDRRLLPADTEVIALINVRQSYEAAGSFSQALQQAGTVLVQRAVVNKSTKLLYDDTPGLAQAMKLLGKAGFDPARDITSIAVAKPESEQVSDRFVIVEGRFDQRKCDRVLRKAGAKTRVGKVSVCKLEPDWLTGKAPWIAVVDGKSLIFAYNENAIKDAVTRVKKDKFVATKVADVLDTLHDRQTFALLASANQARRLFGFLSLRAENGKGICGSVTLSGDIEFELHAVFADKESAKELQASVEAVIPMARRLAAGQAQQDERMNPLVDIANSLRVSRSENHCVVSANASYTGMARLLSLNP